MSKKLLVDRIYKDIKFRNIPKIAIEEMLEHTFDLIIRDATYNISSKLTDFGSFNSKIYQQKKGHDPNTGEKIIIPKQKTLKFKAAAKLRKIIE